jgi:hypothetical protein
LIEIDYDYDHDNEHGCLHPEVSRAITLADPQAGGPTDNWPPTADN